MATRQNIRTSDAPWLACQRVPFEKIEAGADNTRGFNVQACRFCHATEILLKIGGRPSEPQRVKVSKRADFPDGPFRIKPRSAGTTMVLKVANILDFIRRMG